LAKIALTCFLDRRLGQVQLGGDAGVAAALRHLTQHVEFARREANRNQPWRFAAPRPRE
jgi:hypothetical protein